MPSLPLPTVALLAAWIAGAVLAVAAPGWPFSGAPLVCLLASAIAWQAATTGLGRPSLARVIITGSVAALLVALAIASYVTGRTPVSFAFGASTAAILVAALLCFAGVRHPEDREQPRRASR